MLMHGKDQPARLHYMPYSFRVVAPGDFVVCAATGQKILLDDLRYWSIERQEPYVDAEASTQAELKWRKERGLTA
ncbi:MAG: DUF2093 domain-containing protein [Sphingobium sp.]